MPKSIDALPHRVVREAGLTLVELLIVAAIVAILAGLSVLAYWPYLSQAHSVEAEVALQEIDRLQVLYHEAHGRYAADADELGYLDSLTYYTVKVQLLGGGDALYGIVAAPKSGHHTGHVVVLTRYRNGTTTTETLSGGQTATGNPIGGATGGPTRGPTGGIDGSNRAEGTGAGAKGSGSGTSSQGMMQTVVQTDGSRDKGAGADR